MLKKFLIFAPAIWMTSCMTVGREFTSDITSIKQGTTEQKDARLLYGEPYQVGNSSGTPTWTYGYYRYSLFGESHSKELKIYWNDKGKVDRYTFSSSFPSDLAAPRR